MLDTGYWVLDAGCWILVSGCWSSAAEFVNSVSDLLIHSVFLHSFYYQYNLTLIFSEQILEFKPIFIDKTNDVMRIDKSLFLNHYNSYDING